MNKKKIVLIVVYFGNLPWYLSVFLKSCKANKDVDFLIFVDNPYYTDIPNVRFILISRSEFQILVYSKTGIEIELIDPYKLCDFKPLYGFIFQDHIYDFDFWGYTDIDVIFGNIRYFLSNKILSRYDVISGNEFYTSGVFTIFRNVTPVNTLFFKCPQLRIVLTSSKVFSFDEANFKFHEFFSNQLYTNISSEIKSMTHIVKEEEDKGQIKVLFDYFILEGIPGRLKWNNGELIYNNSHRVLLYNMMMFKHMDIKIRNYNIIPNTFRISRRTIYW